MVNGNSKNFNYQQVFRSYIRARRYDEHLPNDFRRDETQRLVRLYKNNGLDEKGKEQTRERILELNFPFIFKRIGLECKKKRRIDLFPVVLSRAVELYLGALDKFDFERNFLFSTYAGSRLKGAISREFLRDGQGKRYEDASLEAIADAGHIFEGEGCEDSGERVVHLQDLRDSLEKAFNHIRKRIRDGERIVEVLKRRFYQEQKLDEIGTDLGITRERVRQIEKKGINFLKGYYLCSDVENPNI